MSDYVSLKQLAEELGLDRSNMRKYVIKHGFTPVAIRLPETRGQLTLALSKEEAELVKEMRRRQGFIGQPRPVTSNGWGSFYVIQLVPELDPNRVKLGFTNDLSARLDAIRTAAPTATLLKHWPCMVSWERTAIASITRIGCDLIANEVYRCDSLEELMARGDAFFSLLPSNSDK